MAYRNMKDPEFRARQREAKYAPHIAPINHLVDSLRKGVRGRIPYVDSLYGGVEAEVLMLKLHPGPGTDPSKGGSGFLSPENDDPTAELFSVCLERAGLDRSRVITWNAYPWGLESGNPTPSQLDLGTEPLRKFIEMLPRLKTVVLMGKGAQDGWKKFATRYPDASRRLKVFSTLDTSGRGIVREGQQQKSPGADAVIETFVNVRQFIDGASALERTVI